jgi:Ferritin-like domain
MNVSKGTPRVEIESTQSGVEAEQRLPRRGLLAAGIGGAAVSLLPFFSGRASATTPPATDESTTTTVPPRRPTDDDVTLLAAALQIELTVEGLYRQAISEVAGWTEAQAAVMTTLRQAHHREFDLQRSGLLGKSAPSTRSEELFDEWKSDFSGSTDEVLAKAAELESTLVATHLDVLAKLQGTNGAALVASIQVAEARHVTALRDLAGVTDEAELLVDEEAASLLGAG